MIKVWHLLALAAFTILACPWPARAALSIDIMAPPMASLEEGTSATIDFRISNNGTVNATIDAIGKPLIGDIFFVRGDRLDEVFSTTVTDPNGCVGMNLMVGQGCIYRQKIETRDLNPPLSGQDEGVWDVFNRVDFHDTAMPADKDLKLGGLEVHVTDPIITAEPSGVALLGTALFALFGSIRGWRVGRIPEG